jgi:putative membrane protein
MEGLFSVHLNYTGLLKLKKKSNMSWKDAFFNSPGPRSLKSSMLLMLKGLCMGAADTVPGVSGGTIALITGIYEDLLSAIKSFDVKMIGRVLKLDFKGALAELHIRFLFSLLLGIGISILSLAQLMNYLLHYHPVATWSLFFGLIVASIWVVGKQVGKWTPGTGVSFLVGAGAAFIIVNLMPTSTPEDLWFVFLSGVVAICAMILPGLSGAFILLILGKYEFIIATLKNPFLLENIQIIIVFLSGCAVGLAGFSRVLKLLLQKYHGLTLAFLTGLMFGSMRKIWPWKETLETAMIHGKLRVLKESNIWPAAFNSDLCFAVLLIVIGFITVICLERLSRVK